MKNIPLRHIVLSLAFTCALGTAHSADQQESAAVPASASVAAPASAPVEVPASAPGLVPVASSPKGSLTVTYSTEFIDGNRLKATPTEVGIVTRSQSTTAAAGQAAVNVLSLFAVGGMKVGGFGKEVLVGAPIEGVQERGHLQNPVPEAFVTSLQRGVSQFLENDAKLRDTVFKKPLIVAGGTASLVYETLSSKDEEQYLLKAYVMVYKAKERWSMMPNMPVYCAMQSQQPMLLADWAVDNFRGVKAQFDEMLAGCQTKVIEGLPVMLKN
ncbi:hypothetical protein HZ993_22400 [Rhodoferax sp. AJA081-3]|uniref:hypothetical protein n=1 Tax=Rhodoferax sp. AJA081-3 TaxID=2752316 RepID=UPI001AE0B931|nr:hypothetical protein [Rhodoferax sp. AJA081-3]QTN27969.1 hypothetical protein HZ993_22400 [Rhodoferax sp. AJA081-3]